MTSPALTVEQPGAPAFLDAADVQRLLSLSSTQAAYRVMREGQVAGVTVIGGRRRRVVSAIFSAWVAAGAPTDVAKFERDYRKRQSARQ